MYTETESEMEIIAKATKEQNEIAITIYTPWDGDQTEILQPMVVGSDALGFPFAWGYLPERNCYYKFYVDIINEIVETGHSYQIPKDVKYEGYNDGYIDEKADDLLVV